MATPSALEPWLRGGRADLPPVHRAVVHALALAEEDLGRWCSGLDPGLFFSRPFGLPSVAFQLRHIGRSLDRFFTYAEGAALNEEQLAGLAAEMDAGDEREAVLAEFHRNLSLAEARLVRTVGRPLEEVVRIGRKGLPVSLAGLLIHAAEHTQRHAGQAITTAKILLGHPQI